MHRLAGILVAVLLLAGLTAPPSLLGPGGAAGAEDPAVRAGKGLVPHNDETVEVRMAFSLWGDHQDLLRQNQRMIDTMNEENRALVKALVAAGAAVPRKVGVRTPLVKQIAGLRGGQLERVFMRTIMERNSAAVAMMNAGLKGTANATLRQAYQQSIARRHAENNQLRAWMKQWYP